MNDSCRVRSVGLESLNMSHHIVTPDSFLAELASCRSVIIQSTNLFCDYFEGFVGHHDVCLDCFNRFIGDLFEPQLFFRLSEP